MERIKQNLIRDVTKEIPKLPRENQMYLLGIMQGMLMAGEKQEQQKGSQKNEENKNDRYFF